MNILITSAGRRVSLVKAFQNELNFFFPEGQIIAVDFNTSLSAACQISEKSFELPLLDDSSYIEKLLELCIVNQVKLIIPTIDPELYVLSKNREVFLKNGIIPIVSSKTLIDICGNKRKTHDFFYDKGIDFAKEFSKNNYSLPLYIKPVSGSRSSKNYIVEHQNDFKPCHFENENLIFLEYLDHNQYDEFTCDLYYDRNHFLKCVVPRKRIEVRDGEVSKGVTRKNDLVEYITDHLNYIEGAIGCLCAQFFKHKNTNQIYGIEINARFGGGYPLTYFAGANYPRWIIQEYLLNQNISKFNDWKGDLLMLRYDNEILVHDYKEA
ncbi:MULTISPECIES: ATP-grasp domain-containing protein [Mangrovimonas]|uniref:ATP-grasp domain-containing protein n=1 Tax=Mangrovimonas TaxID=1211036 RepID=UPI0006B54204|nr:MULTISPECIES: ATP-grasp domain-containing protein [Mangrovimonas]OMP30679.1 carbamoyl phosphate synthase large subunit [Mangrovimonas sp. DI 80]